MGISNPTSGTAVWNLIFDDTLEATGRFDVTGIQPIYDDLVFRFLRLRSDAAGDSDFGQIFLNDDTTDANYRSEVTRTGSTSGGDIREDVTNINDAPFFTEFPSTDATADYFASGHVQIANYADAKTKIVEVKMHYRIGANEISHIIATVHWESTAAITQVTIQPDGFAGDEFVIDSRLQVYGVVGTL